jgi:hypothetical protein
VTKRERNAPSYEVSLDHDGKSFSGRYQVTSGVITVTCTLGSRTTQLGGSSAESLAIRLLSEIVRAGK